MKLEEKSDGELLAEFFATRQGVPFEEMLRRYDTLVAAVCRRVLGSGPDAEDVAQAVFLTLARKAGALRGQPSVAGWLHRVARDMSRNVLKLAVRRRRREVEASHMSRSRTREAGWDDIQPLVDQEMDALPEKYRVPLILHYLQQRTQKEVGRDLGCKRSLISMRLIRGLEMLRGRLIRRGVAVSGGALAGLLMEHAASAAISSAILASTVKAATLMAAGKGTSGLVSAQVTALVKGGLKAMMFAKLKIAAAAVMAAGVVGTGGGALAYKALAPEQEARAETVKAPVVPKGLPPAIPVEKFKKLHDTIKPYPGEFAWLDDIPWLISIQEAREKAAAEGKPIAIWAAAAGHHLGHT